MAEKENIQIKTGGGIGLSGILTVIFVTLKLVGEHFHTPVADWSWWWVLAPFWIPLGIFLTVMLIGGTILLAAMVLEKRR